jgi:hypothetical protein
MTFGLPPALCERSSAICVICVICGLLFVRERPDPNERRQIDITMPNVI